MRIEIHRLWGASVLMVALVTALAGVTSGAATGKSAPKSAKPAAAARDTAPVPRIGVPQAMLAAQRGEAVLVDVRTEGQRQLGHIRGDLSMPIDEVPAEHSKLPRNRTIIFYCSCPEEELALEAARVLIKAGNTRVAAMVGGFDAWRAAHGPIETGQTWEEVFRVDDVPSGWGKTPIDSLRCRYARDVNVAARGAASGRIGCVPDSAAVGFAGFSQRIDPHLCRGRLVVLDAMVKTEQVGQGAFLFVAAQNASGKMITMSQSPLDSLKGTRDWHELQVQGGVPTEAQQVLIGISLIGAGRVWLDDVRLVAPEGNGMARVRMVVANPGFEE